MTLHFLGSRKSSSRGTSAASQTLGSVADTVGSLSASSLARTSAPGRREEGLFRLACSRCPNSSTRERVGFGFSLEVRGTSEGSLTAALALAPSRLLLWLLAKEKNLPRI